MQYFVFEKTGQVRVGLAHRVFRTKIGSLEVFLKFFRFSLAGALSSDTSLERAALIPNFAQLSMEIELVAVAYKLKRCLTMP